MTCHLCMMASTCCSSLHPIWQQLDAQKVPLHETVVVMTMCCFQSTQEIIVSMQTMLKSASGGASADRQPTAPSPTIAHLGAALTDGRQPASQPYFDVSPKRSTQLSTSTAGCSNHALTGRLGAGHQGPMQLPSKRGLRTDRTQVITASYM